MNRNDSAYLLGAIAAHYDATATDKSSLLVHCFQNNTYAAQLFEAVKATPKKFVASDNEEEVCLEITDATTVQEAVKMLNDGNKLPYSVAEEGLHDFARGFYEHISLVEIIKWNESTIPFIEMDAKSVFLVNLITSLAKALDVELEANDDDNKVGFRGKHAVNFLGKLYDSAQSGCYDVELFRKYVNLITIQDQKLSSDDVVEEEEEQQQPTLPSLMVKLISEDAKLPYKKSVMNRWYSVDCLERNKETDLCGPQGLPESSVIEYNTGIQLGQLPYGWAIDFHSTIRSADGKPIFGWMLTDFSQNEDETLKITLSCVIPQADFPKLPFTAHMQIIRHQHFQISSYTSPK